MHNISCNSNICFYSNRQNYTQCKSATIMVHENVTIPMDHGIHKITCTYFWLNKVRKCINTYTYIYIYIYILWIRYGWQQHIRYINAWQQCMAIEQVNVVYISVTQNIFCIWNKSTWMQCRYVCGAKCGTKPQKLHNVILHTHHKINVLNFQMIIMSKYTWKPRL